MTPYYDADGIQVWRGDCLDVMKELPAESVDFVLTDPPYLVDFQSNRRIIKHKKIAGDIDDAWLQPAFDGIFRLMKKDALALSFYGMSESETFFKAWRLSGLKYKWHFAFKKSNIGVGWFARSFHECGVLLYKGNPAKPPYAIPDVIEGQMTGNEYHPTQKPLEWLYPIIECYTKPGDLVLDPFGGSLSTAVACKRLGRRCVTIELDETYVKRGIERLVQRQLL